MAVAPEAAKRRLRRRMTALCRDLDPARRRAAGDAASRRLLDTLDALGPGRVGLYAALPDELPTRPLFEALVARDTPVLLPRTASGGWLDFCRVARWADLAPGRFGLLEPAAGEAEVLGPGDAVVVPGLAFDPAGWRLGRGGGYYDRSFAAAAPRAPTLIGYALEAQVVEAVPHDSRDRRMDAIVTERRVRWVEGEPV